MGLGAVLEQGRQVFAYASRALTKPENSHGGIEFQEPFLKNLAPRSLPKMSAIFSRGPNLKWPPGLTKMSIKNDFEQLFHQ